MLRLAAVTLAIGLLCVATASAQENRWLQDRAPLNIAHQGGEDEFPLNNWFSGDDRDAPRHLAAPDRHVLDGIMTSRSRALERVLRRHERPAACGRRGPGPTARPSP